MLALSLSDFKRGMRVRIKKGRDVQVPFDAKAAKGQEATVKGTTTNPNRVDVQLDSGKVVSVPPESLELVSGQQPSREKAQAILEGADPRDILTNRTVPYVEQNIDEDRVVERTKELIKQAFPHVTDDIVEDSVYKTSEAPGMLGESDWAIVSITHEAGLPSFSGPASIDAIDKWTQKVSEPLENEFGIFLEPRNAAVTYGGPM